MMRSAFAGAETLWQSLTDVQRTAWNDYAATLSFTGPLGAYTVPGRQVFIGNMGTAGYWKARGAGIGALTPTAPTIPGFLDLDNVTEGLYTTAASTGIAFDATYNGAEDLEIMAQRSVAYNPSRNRFKGPYASATMDFTSLVAPQTVTGEFTGLSEDYIYFILVRAITGDAPFRLSAKYYLRTTAITNV